MLQGLTRPIANWLKVTLPEPHGFLIVGANLVAREIGKALAANGIRVLLADNKFEEINKAKHEGLETFFGNTLSMHVGRNLNLSGIGRLLALSPHESENVAAAMHYRLELDGTMSIYFSPGLRNVLTKI